MAQSRTLMLENKCFVDVTLCLRRGHLSRDCRSTHHCHLCNGRHHTSICVPRLSKTTSDPTAPAAQPPPPPMETTSSLNPSAPEFEPSTEGTSLYLDASKSIILQTAVAEVYNPTDCNQRRKVRVILDCGSQHTYLSEQARRDLRLETTCTQRLSIATFGSRRARARPCNIVTLRVWTKSGKDPEIDLFVVPDICNPLIPQPH